MTLPYTIKMWAVHSICHPERSAAESKDLRTVRSLGVTVVRRSFDALRLLRMTTFLKS